MFRSYLALALLRCGGERSLTSMVQAQAINQSHYDSMRWRMIGPFRGGRTVGAVGVPSQPNVFFIGVNNGGVWKTDDYGRTWNPIFDDQPTGSIGSLAVAPSNPDIIYVGSGEGLQRPDLSVGDGVYKSTDGGKTWKHMGLRDGQQIPAIIVDPKDPNRVFVAVLGHPYGANTERGVFRSTDGGKTWTKVLYKDENTGGMALAFDPTNSQTIYAVLWSARQGPWENGAWQGSTQRPFQIDRRRHDLAAADQGPADAEDGLGRIGFDCLPQRSQMSLSPWSTPRARRSVTAPMTPAKVGGSINGDKRVWGRGGDFAEVKVDPKNKDDASTSPTPPPITPPMAAKPSRPSRALPAATTLTPSGSTPTIRDIILLAGDQGACVTVNGGETWSSWYNQPTAQFYHVITDNQFPYWVYGGQQESGSAGRASRGNDGQITFRDWHPVGVEEYGYVAPDPLNPNFIYGGKVTRYDRRTGASRRTSVHWRQGLRKGMADYRYAAHRPAGVFHRRSARAFLRRQRAVQDDRRRQELGNHQPGLVAGNAGGAGQHRHLSHAAIGQTGPPRRHLHGRTVVQGRRT